MKRLLWKELRERAWWLGCWALATFGVAFFGGQWWHAQGVLFTPWMALPFALALVVGTGAYASELGGGRAPFLYARPLRWQAVLGAKVLVGLAVIGLMPLLAGMLYALFGTEPHRTYVTAGTIFANTWPLVWVMGVLYLTGLACSVLLPGLAGGLLTLIGVVLVAVAVGILGQGIIPPVFLREITLIVGTVAGTVLAVFCAGLPLMRFGLTLGVDARMKRFAPTFTLVLLAVVVTSMLLPTRLAERLLLRWQPIRTSISPGGSYVFTVYARRYCVPGFRIVDWDSDQKFTAMAIDIRRMDSRRPVKPISQAQLWDSHVPTFMSPANYLVWANDEVIWFHHYTDSGMALYYPDTGRIVRFSGVTADYRRTPAMSDQRYLLVREQRQRGKMVDGTHGGSVSERYFRIIDLQQARLLPLAINAEEMGSRYRIWWQDADTLVYLDKGGIRHVVELK